MNTHNVYRQAPRQEPDCEVLRFLDAEEVGRRLGVTGTPVRRWAREGLPGFPKQTPRGFREWEIDRHISDSRIRGRVSA